MRNGREQEKVVMPVCKAHSLTKLLKLSCQFGFLEAKVKRKM